MSEKEDVKLPLQVVINRQNTSVLFAEFDSDLADVLLSFLTLPLGRIVKLLRKHYGEGAPVIGSLNTLYSGLENLDDVCFSTKECKEMLLDPKSSFSHEYCGRLKLNIDDSPTTYFACPKPDNYHRNVNLFGHARCKYCSWLMKKQVSLRSSDTATSTARGVFTIKNMSFNASNDLQILSNASTFLLQNAQQFGIMDTKGMQLKTLEIDRDDAMELLKGLFFSRTPITDLVKNKWQMMHHTDLVKNKRQMMHHPMIDKRNVTVSPILHQNDHAEAKKYSVKVVVQKSSNKLLFLQANDDFVDFILSLLLVPLGAVADLLGGNTSFVCIDNLYRSIFSADKDCHLMDKGAKELLLQLHHGYLSKKNILPLAERPNYMYSNTGQKYSVNDPKGFDACHVGGPRKYIVTDDLTVMPSTMFSDLSQFNKMNVLVSEAEEVGLDIGLQEALSILKASLVSTTVLTDTLMPLLQKQPKKEYDT